MQTIKIITFGKLKEDYLKKAISEYEKRLTPLCDFKIIELEPCRLSENPSNSEIEKALEKEGEEVLKLTGTSNIVTLCIEGKEISSMELSQYIKNCSTGGESKISFIIGSSFGISQKLKEKSKLKLSMSKMTFPHQLARVMLSEQIYRAFQILNGTKYHK